jgi:hypothetical protein
MRFPISRSAVLGGAAVIAAAFLASCTVVVEEGPGYRPPPPPPGPRVCTREYDPVCGRNGPVMQTFPNACIARAEGFRIVYPGTCRPAGGPPPGPGPGFCTREYAPVCARRRGDVRTFGNSCEAESAGYRIVGRGPC